MRCERIALPTEPYPHRQFTNSIIINTQKKCKHNYIKHFTNFDCYVRIFFTWRHGSAGRAFASHARGHRFESCCLHHLCSTKKLQNIKSTRFSRSCAFLLLYLEFCALRGIFEFKSCISTCFSKNRTRTDDFVLIPA